MSKEALRVICELLSHLDEVKEDGPARDMLARAQELLREPEETTDEPETADVGAVLDLIERRLRAMEEHRERPPVVVGPPPLSRRLPPPADRPYRHGSGLVYDGTTGRPK